MKTSFIAAAALACLLASCGTKGAQDAGNLPQAESNQEETLTLTQAWDKVFPQSDKVNHTKITFHNRYGITLAADLYMPKDATGKLPAIAMSGPYGAVKEQVSGLYAQTLAERGFLTIAFDPSFTGESGGQPRAVSSPDINTEDYRNGTYAHAGGNPEVAPADAPQFLKDYVAFYKTKRGYHPRSLGSNEGFNTTAVLSLINMPILAYAGEIRSAVLLVHGEKAHSRYFSETVYKQLKGDNKQLLIVPDAVHTDLYDNLEKIPFDQIETFFRTYLK